MKKLLIVLVISICAALSFAVTRERYYCRNCGTGFESVQELSEGRCYKSDTGKHTLFNGEYKAPFLCGWCGKEYNSIKDMMSTICDHNPTGRTHNIYEGKLRKTFICQYCNRGFSCLQEMSCLTCYKSPTARHSPK